MRDAEENDPTPRVTEWPREAVPSSPEADDSDAGMDDGRSETPNQRADRNWVDLLQELRVAQTGTQILAGFLLAVAFQPRFTELDVYQLTLYLALVALAGLATVLGLAPVSVHRAYFGRRRKARLVQAGARLLTADLVVVAVLAAGVTSLVFDFTLGRVAGICALGIGLVVMLVLLVLVPRFGIRRAMLSPADRS